jgi:S-formylglutathione hydrolase FrmB
MQALKLVAAIAIACAVPAFSAPGNGQVVSRELRSSSLVPNRIGTDPLRKMMVYLPGGYDGSTRRYPVIYFLANAPDGYRDLFDQKGAQQLFDAAIASGSIGPFLLVSVDTNTPNGASWCTNSSVTGNWEDFLVRELVPYMDEHFRTLADRNSRGLLGDRMGGYGAIRLGMRHPEVFGSVYAMHPVGTGTGLQVMYARPNWDLMARAKSVDDLRNDTFSMIFLSIFQAHVPNPDKPPLFVDLPAQKAGGELTVDSQLTDRLHNSFLLETMIPQYADNLKSLRGLQFDWGRNDTNQDHVYSNQAFAHKLDEWGVPYEAEEYRGFFGERNWGMDGRVYTTALPFFQRHLVFEDGH